jgi:hypothetical protein
VAETLKNGSLSRGEPVWLKQNGRKRPESEENHFGDMARVKFSRDHSQPSAISHQPSAISHQPADNVSARL